MTPQTKPPLIVTVTPNPSIDKAVVIPDYRLGAIHRPQKVVALAGGKGLNVSRTIHRLGGEVLACVILSGHKGHWMADQLAEEGIKANIVWGEGETRTSTSVVDPRSKQLTEIYEHGVPISAETWHRFEEAYQKAVEGARLSVFSGSLPPGAPADGYAVLARLSQAVGRAVLVDTHGEALGALMKANPALVKINVAEATELVDRKIQSREEAIAAAQRIHRLGIDTVIITMGKQGAVAVNENGKWFASPPQVETIASVGSGDALLGGLALGLAQGKPLVDAFRLGIAAGAVNATTLGTGVVTAEAVQTLMREVEVRTYS